MRQLVTSCSTLSNLQHTGLGGTVTFHSLRTVCVWEGVKTATAGRFRRERCSMPCAERRTGFDEYALPECRECSPSPPVTPAPLPCLLATLPPSRSGPGLCAALLKLQRTAPHSLII